VEFLNPFLNFHRPCLFSTDVPDPREPGRIRPIYRPQDAMTPLDKLASLPDAATFMREGITLEDLRAQPEQAVAPPNRKRVPGPVHAVAVTPWRESRTRP
jgi:hypothetical protein